MSENTQLMLIIVGILVCGLLAWVLTKQLKRERAVKAEQQQQLQALQQKAQEQRDYLIESVRVISLAMRDEQCELAEGCIRLKVLLDHLAPFLHEHEDFSIINQMYEATKHMPILDEWKKLKLRQRFELTQQREALEEQHREPILLAVGKLAAYNFQH